MHEAIEAIEYYQQYYKWELLMALSITMGGWIQLLIQELYLKPQQLRQKKSNAPQIVIILTALSILGLITFNYGKSFSSSLSLNV